MSVQQLQRFLKLDQEFQFAVTQQRERYTWIATVLTRFQYHRLHKKKDRHIVRHYIQKMTNVSSSQLTRLITKHQRTGQLIPYATVRKRNCFHTMYTPVDIALLMETDVAHQHLSGAATKKILQREYEIFGRTAYKTIANISVAHIYNIRNHNRQYNSSDAKWIARTKATPVPIGIRSKPNPQGKPGFLRVDTVHQGDWNGRKGVYHINIVDEVTQYELIATIEKISEHFLTPVITELLLLFPFIVVEFHADNGSEYINHVVAALLAKLYVRFTKSRGRCTNDNALVESKNGSVIRKLYGRNYIPATAAAILNQFNNTFVNVYLNYHRPCGFAEQLVNTKGKIKKKYNQWLTPFEKLKSLPHSAQYLKPNVSFDQLNQIAYAESDNQFAKRMNIAKQQLWQEVRTFI